MVTKRSRGIARTMSGKSDIVGGWHWRAEDGLAGVTAERTVSRECIMLRARSTS